MLDKAHYARAWDELRHLAELLAAPVTTSLEGKSSFPENHPLSLGSGGRAIPQTVHHFLRHADLVFGIGCSFTETAYGVSMPKGKRILHAPLDPDHLSKDVRATIGLAGDARLTVAALRTEVEKLLPAPRPSSAVTAEIARMREGWLAQWMPKLTCEETPLSPYRVIWDLQRRVVRGA